MNTMDRKLDALTSALTARQRAILVIRPWMLGEEPDERLTQLCPPQDKAEFDGIIRAVQRGNTELHSPLVYLLEWLAQTELKIHWLRTLRMYQERERAIPATVRKALPAFPAVWDTERTVLRSWGVATPDDAPPSTNWTELTDKLAGEIVQSISTRWRDFLQTQAAIEEASEALGSSVEHQEMTKLLQGLKDGVLKLHSEMESLGFRVELPVLDGSTNFTEGVFRLEVLRERPTERHAREWMNEQARKELEDWEREQAKLSEDG